MIIQSKPIYFVCGNHDYYRGDIASVRNELVNQSEQNPQLFWLNATGPEQLAETTIVVGQDGWVDGRYGNYVASTVVLNDSRLINDLLHESIVGVILLKYR